MNLQLSTPFVRGILPLALTQDIGGPLARTVSDLSVMLDATVGRDPDDAATQAGEGRLMAKYLKPDNSTLGLFLPTKSPDRSHVPPVGNLEASIGNYKGRSSISGG